MIDTLRTTNKKMKNLLILNIITEPDWPTRK